MRTWLPLLWLCVTCNPASPPPAGVDGSASGDLLQPSGDLAQACRGDKMTFTQDKGCENDGSVEFCIPAADPGLLAALQGIEPMLRCSRGGGRARCDVNTELLCFFPTGEASCVSRHGALTDPAWGKLCQIAAFDPIRQIVPTWFE